jgi:hypothetical protein
MRHKTYANTVRRVDAIAIKIFATWVVVVAVLGQRAARVRCSRKRNEESDDGETHVVGTVVSVRRCFVSFVFRALLIT